MRVVALWAARRDRAAGCSAPSASRP